jgi:hypothetical protein
MVNLLADPTVAQPRAPIFAGIMARIERGNNRVRAGDNRASPSGKMNAHSYGVKTGERRRAFNARNSPCHSLTSVRVFNAIAYLDNQGSLYWHVEWASVPSNAVIM